MAPPGEEAKMTPRAIWKRFRAPIVLGILSLICIILSVVLLLKSLQPASPIQFFEADVAQEFSNLSTQSANPASPAGRFSFILVDVAGAVIAPGVVRLPVGSRVEDAIASAGGLRKDADTAYVSKNLNRAMKLVDGMKVYIPSVGESIDSMETKSHNISPLLRSPDGTPQNGGGISVNTASQSELESLPGVGPVTATKIIANRPYMSLNELVTKKAMGASLFEKLKNDLSL